MAIGYPVIVLEAFKFYEAVLGHTTSSGKTCHEAISRSNYNIRARFLEDRVNPFISGNTSQMPEVSLVILGGYIRVLSLNEYVLLRMIWSLG